MFRFSYVLDGSGWATATIQCGNDTIAMGASYLCDSLKEIGEAVLKLGRDQSSTAVLMQEPGEYQLEFARSGDNVLIRVEWFDDWKSWGLSCSETELVFMGTVSITCLREAVVRAKDELLGTWGKRGYKRRWVAHEFPIETLNKLRAPS